jgi:hypothetical protein
MSLRKIMCLAGAAFAAGAIGCTPAFAQEETTAHVCAETRKVLASIEQELEPYQADEWIRSEDFYESEEDLDAMRAEAKLGRVSDSIDRPAERLGLEVPKRREERLALQKDLIEYLTSRMRDLREMPKDERNALDLKIERLEYQRDLRRQRLKDLNCDSLPETVADNEAEAAPVEEASAPVEAVDEASELQGYTPGLIERMRSGVGAPPAAAVTGSVMPWNRSAPPPRRPASGAIAVPLLPEPVPLLPEPVPLLPVPSSAPTPFTDWMTGTFDNDRNVFTLNRGSGSYLYANGTMTAERIDGTVVEGTWTQSSSGQQCKDGGYHGRFRITFTEDGFSGLFGYCDEPPGAPGGFQGRRRK